MKKKRLSLFLVGLLSMVVLFGLDFLHAPRAQQTLVVVMALMFGVLLVQIDVIVSMGKELREEKRRHDLLRSLVDEFVTPESVQMVVDHKLGYRARNWAESEHLFRALNDKGLSAIVGRTLLTDDLASMLEEAKRNRAARESYFRTIYHLASKWGKTGLMTIKLKENKPDAYLSEPKLETASETEDLVAR